MKQIILDKIGLLPPEKAMFAVDMIRWFNELLYQLRPVMLYIIIYLVISLIFNYI